MSPPKKLYNTIEILCHSLSIWHPSWKMSGHFRKCSIVFPTENHEVTTPRIQGTDSAGTHDYVNLEADYTPQRLHKNRARLRRCTKFLHELILWKKKYSTIIILHQRLLFDDLMCLHVGNRTTSRYILQTLCIVLTFCIEFCNAACLCLWPKMCSFHVLTHKNQKWKNDHLNFSIISAKGSFVPSLSPFLKTSPEIMRYPTFVHFLQQFVNLCLQPFLRCHGPGLKKGP